MTDTRTEHKRRQALSDHEAMADAQAGCVPCKLCGGKAVISDAGLGAGYYVRCENSGRFRAREGCMIEDRRLGGWAYNVMDWWNRLHATTTAPAKRTFDCTMCDDTGFKDHAWLRMEPCDHQRPAREEVRFDHERLTYAGMMAAMRAVAKTGVMEALDLAIFRGYVHGQNEERSKRDAMETADRLARRMGGRFVPLADHIVDAPDIIPAEPAGDEPVVLPDIGPDPFKGPREEYTLAKAEARLRAAFTIQQKGVPDQTALVWRCDLLKLFHELPRLRSIEEDWREKRPATPTNPERLVEAISLAEIKEIAAAATLSAYESDPADPEHPDTISISTDDFEAIVHCAVENWAERKAAVQDQGEGK